MNQKDKLQYLPLPEDFPHREGLYAEKTRPRFHFTPYTGQMNDPNGLVYNADSGEYHLFFQCNRPISHGVEGLAGTTSWGHAVSTDLLHWQELPLAIIPDRWGMAWSGSAVIDRENCSGLFDASTPPDSRLVLFYASVGVQDEFGYAKESMAYSPDGGRTFLRYPGNPVLPNPDNRYGSGLRDPKVFWFADETMENGGIWVMVVVDRLHIFTSRDLKTWKLCGRPLSLEGKPFDSECPDLFPLAVDGDPNRIKWVYTGGGLFYILGNLTKTGEDTVMFFPETPEIVPLNGIADQIPGQKAPELYATQTFAAEKYGRRISISWLRDPTMNWLDKHWNSAQSLPVEHSLRTIDGRIRLCSWPVAEVESLRGELLGGWENHPVAPGENPLAAIRSDCCDIQAVIDPGQAGQLGFRLRMGGENYLEIRWEREGRLAVDKTHTGPGSYPGIYTPALTTDEDGLLRLRILLDKVCFDVYGGRGEAWASGLLGTPPECTGMELFADREIVLKQLNLWEMCDSR